MAKVSEIKEALSDVQKAVKNLKGKKLTKKEKEEAIKIMQDMDKAMIEFFDKVEKKQKECNS